MVLGEDTFEGTAAELLDKVQPTDPQWRAPKDWPATPRQVTARLRRQAPVMRKAGWVADELGNDNRRSITRWRITPPENPDNGDPRAPRDPRPTDGSPPTSPTGDETAGHAGHAGDNHSPSRDGAWRRRDVCDDCGSPDTYSSWPNAELCKPCAETRIAAMNTAANLLVSTADESTMEGMS